jgi:hypothetical protein
MDAQLLAKLKLTLLVTQEIGMVISHKLQQLKLDGMRLLK